MSARGIPVFNAPGANSNAVKELVVAGLIVACRQICDAWDFARNLEGSDEETAARPSRPARRTSPASSCRAARSAWSASAPSAASWPTRASNLGMNVIGFDPGLTVEGAWALSSNVRKARSLDEVFAEADFLTVHVPLVDATRKMVNEPSGSHRCARALSS